MDTLTIRATREDARPTDVERHKLRDLPYAEYLQTPWWRRRRDQALRHALYRCQQCDAKRELQVHHTTYANIGDEQEADLVVLCRACHEGHHFKESRRRHLGIYIKLVSDTLRTQRFTRMVELVDAVKCACAREHVEYDSERVYEAVERVDANRAGVLDAPQARAWSRRSEYESIGRVEASDILKRLGIVVAFREIKPADWHDPDDAAQQCQEAKQRAAEMGIEL